MSIHDLCIAYTPANDNNEKEYEYYAITSTGKVYSNEDCTKEVQGITVTEDANDTNKYTVTFSEGFTLKAGDEISFWDEGWGNEYSNITFNYSGGSGTTSYEATDDQLTVTPPAGFKENSGGYGFTYTDATPINIAITSLIIYFSSLTNNFSRFIAPLRAYPSLIQR